MTGDAEHLWVSHTARGLLHFISGRLAEEFPWPRLGSDVRARALAVDRKRGGLWLGFYAGAGVAYFQDGQVRARYTHANGLGGEHVADVQLGRTDALWAATDGGLSMIRQGRIQTLSSKNGLPCDTVHWRTRADDRSAWLYMSCGLVRIAQAELDAWMANPNRTVQTTVFEPSDGVRVRPTPLGSYTPQFAKSAGWEVVVCDDRRRQRHRPGPSARSTNSRRRSTSSRSSPTARWFRTGVYLR